MNGIGFCKQCVFYCHLGHSHVFYIAFPTVQISGYITYNKISLEPHTLRPSNALRHQLFSRVQFPYNGSPSIYIFICFKSLLWLQTFGKMLTPTVEGRRLYVQLGIFGFLLPCMHHSQSQTQSEKTILYRMVHSFSLLLKFCVFKFQLASL